MFHAVSIAVRNLLGPSGKRSRARIKARCPEITYLPLQSRFSQQIENAAISQPMKIAKAVISQ
jgi:hypothetical protein